MPILIRLVADRDIPAMAAIRALEWETETYWRNRIAGYLAGTQSPQKALPERAGFVAVDDGVIVGFVAGHRTWRHQCDGELEWINVARESRGSGIAGLLLTRMAAWFVEQNAFRICVDVEPKNAAARAFYAKHGAQRLNDYWMVWEDIRPLAAQPASA